MCEPRGVHSSDSVCVMVNELDSLAYTFVFDVIVLVVPLRHTVLDPTPDVVCVVCVCVCVLCCVCSVVCVLCVFYEYTCCVVLWCTSGPFGPLHR